MPEAGTGAGPDVLSLVFVAAAALALAVGAFLWAKGRKIPGEHVFRASRFSRGNLWFPTQVAVTPTSVVHYTPELVGGREHSMHISHIASVLIDRNLFFSAPHLIFFPGLAITFTVLGFNLLGDGLRDALDPRLNR